MFLLNLYPLILVCARSVHSEDQVVLTVRTCTVIAFARLIIGRYFIYSKYVQLADATGGYCTKNKWKSLWSQLLARRFLLYKELDYSVKPCSLMSNLSYLKLSQVSRLFGELLYLNYTAQVERSNSLCSLCNSHSREYVYYVSDPFPLSYVPFMLVATNYLDPSCFWRKQHKDY